VPDGRFIEQFHLSTINPTVRVGQAAALKLMSLCGRERLGRSSKSSSAYGEEIGGAPGTSDVLKTLSWGKELQDNYRDTISLMGLYGFIWVYMGLYGFILLLMDVNGVYTPTDKSYKWGGQHSRNS
jgi:hypothetical protein